MTGSTAAISISATLSGATVPPTLLAPGAPGGVPSLATFVDLMIGQPAASPEPAVTDDRQDDAATGKSLPDQGDDKDGADLSWLLAAAVAPPLAAVGAEDVPLAGTSNVTLDVAAKPAAEPQPLPGEFVVAPPVADVPAEANPLAATAAPADPIDTGKVVSDPAQPQPAATPLVQTVAPQPQPQPVVMPPIVVAVVLAPQITPAVTVDAPAPIAPAPVAATADAPPVATVRVRAAPVPPVAQPDTQTIAAAMLRAPRATPVAAARVLAAGPQPALFALAMGRERDDDDARPAAPTLSAAALLQPADAAALIAKPGEAERQALDLGRQDWPQKMIDRIEALRDDANANDTSIRLKPEALGRVDVSLKAHGDGAVSVRFAAETPATRALIADAAPQLQAAAEARGIRLTQTSVDLGAGQDSRPRPQFEAQQNSSNRLAATGEDNEAVADGRIA